MTSNIVARLQSLLPALPALSSPSLPMLQSIASQILAVVDVAFTPRFVMKQVVMIVSLQCTILIVNLLHRSMTHTLKYFTSHGREMQRLEKLLSTAESYSVWKDIAERIDDLKGLSSWRAEEESTLYDCRVLRKRIDDIQSMMNRRDVFNLIFRLRGGLARDQYGMQHEGLFTRTTAGTKYIIQQYHETVCKALAFICDYDGRRCRYSANGYADNSDDASNNGDDEVDEIPTDTKLAFYNETRHAYGRTALLLSGGAALGYFHVGLAR